ncbi:MAG: hypothetical protein AB8C95_14325 [Phycisphaeraceae bacterium]
MQHRYVPDLGDFSKFAVIDALSGSGRDPTALIWYLVDPEEVGDHHNNDGKHTAYLEHDRQGLAQCHPDLYKKFQVIHAAGEKSVEVYERHEVLPNINYFAEQVSYNGRSLKHREVWRKAWLERAMQTAYDSSLVVLDPDNGLLPGRLSIRSQSAIKYAALDECKAFYGDGQRTLVVYQHAHRQGSAAEQAENALTRLTSHLGIKRQDAFALRFHRGTTRFYLVACAKQKQCLLRDRAAAMIESEWGKRGHYSLIE